VQQADSRIDRAVDAVLAVRKPLTELVIALGNAQAWGMRDVETSSIAASLRKHGRLNEARLHQRRLQALLAQHRAELEALGRADPVIAKITPLEVFKDLEESWLFDWIVQGRIKESIARAKELNRRLTAFLTRLAEERSALRARTLLLEASLDASTR
jgi:hypothetical protein